MLRVLVTTPIALIPLFLALNKQNHGSHSMSYPHKSAVQKHCWKVINKQQGSTKNTNSFLQSSVQTLETPRDPTMQTRNNEKYRHQQLNIPTTNNYTFLYVVLKHYNLRCNTTQLLVYYNNISNNSFTRNVETIKARQAGDRPSSRLLARSELNWDWILF